MDGMVKNNVNLTAWPKVSFKASRSFETACRDRLGKTAVAAAMANMPNRITSYNVCYTKLLRVSKIFGVNTIAVDKVSCTIADGEFFILLGPSGCGKSSLLNMIVGVITSYSIHYTKLYDGKLALNVIDAFSYLIRTLGCRVHG